MSSLYSRLTVNAALWSHHEPNYATQLAIVGAATATDRTATLIAIVNSNAHSPTVVAFQLDAEPTKVYIGHTPNRFPADLNATTPFDDLVMVMAGDDLEEAFSRTNDYAFYNKAYIKGANGYAAPGGSVVQFDRQAAGGGAVDTDDFRVRKVNTEYLKIL